MVKSKINKEKLASAASSRVWSEQDELLLLKGLVEYRAKIGFITRVEWDAFHPFAEDSIVEKFSKDQILSKINKLKWKYLSQSEKINQGIDPNFTTFNDPKAFRLGMMIWEKNEPQIGLKEHEGLLKEDDVAADKTLNENGGGKESHEAEDEFCYVKDAFETLISHGLSDYQKSLQLEKLMKLGSGIRRKLIDEWKTLCAKERNLNIKKLEFSAKIEKATIGS